MPGVEGFNRWCARWLKDEVIIEKHNGRTGKGRDTWDPLSGGQGIPCRVQEGVGVNKSARSITVPFEDEVIVRGDLDLHVVEGARYRLKVSIFNNEKDDNGNPVLHHEKILEAVSIEAPQMFGFDNRLTVIQANNA